MLEGRELINNGTQLIEPRPVQYTEIFTKNKDSKAKVIVNVGGAGSSKSYSLAQLLIYRLINEKGKTFGVIRKTFPALRMTAMGLVLDLLKDYGIYKEEKHNKTANTYTFGTNMIWFFSIDESTKIRSTNFNYIWVEEADEITWEDFVILKLRLRAPVKEGEINSITLSLNPANSTGWIAKKLCGIETQKADDVHSKLLPGTQS